MVSPIVSREREKLAPSAASALHRRKRRASHARLQCTAAASMAPGGSTDSVKPTPLLYRGIRGWFNACGAVFYATTEVHGLEDFPATGPTILCFNHGNGLADPLVLIRATPRMVRFCAKDTLWKVPIMKYFIRNSGAVPVYRSVEHGGKAKDMNLEVFDKVISALREGDCLGFAPEGVSRFLPYMEQPLKTGVARIALEAVRQSAEAGDPAFRVRILPVCLNFTHREKFRSDLCMRYRKPIYVDAGLIAAHTNASGEFDSYSAAKSITDNLNEEMQRNTINAPEWETTRLAITAARLHQPLGTEMTLDQYLCAATRRPLCPARRRPDDGQICPAARVTKRSSDGRSRRPRSAVASCQLPRAPRSPRRYLVGGWVDVLGMTVQDKRLANTSKYTEGSELEKPLGKRSDSTLEHMTTVTEARWPRAAPGPRPPPTWLAARRTPSAGSSGSRHVPRPARPPRHQVRACAPCGDGPGAAVLPVRDGDGAARVDGVCALRHRRPRPRGLGPRVDLHQAVRIKRARWRAGPRLHEAHACTCMQVQVQVHVHVPSCSTCTCRRERALARKGPRWIDGVAEMKMMICGLVGMAVVVTCTLLTILRTSLYPVGFVYYMCARPHPQAANPPRPSRPRPCQCPYGWSSRTRGTGT